MSFVSVKAFVQGYLFHLLSRILHASRARQAPFKYSGPPFRAPHTLPTEIILHIAGFLDVASLLALHHTNRDLFYIISLIPDEIPHLREARYLADLTRLTNGHNKHNLNFCTNCQELRSLKSFSLSEIMALERLQEASCLRHAQMWMCPHVSCDYKQIKKLLRLGSGFREIDEMICHLRCDRKKCRTVFYHRILDFERFPLRYYSIKSTISVLAVYFHDDPATLRDPIQRYLTKTRVQRAVGNIRAPLCDHHLLSDQEVLKKYDPADIDFKEYQCSALPCERLRPVRESDGSCSFCQAQGVQTKFRFLARTGKSDFAPTMGWIYLYAVVIRSLGACSWKMRDQPDEHWRCHGETERRLAKFRDSWIQSSSDIGRVILISSDGEELEAEM
jgi:hypothetical protein